MFVKILQPEWETPDFVINTRHIVTASEVLVKHRKRQTKALRLSMADGKVYHVIAGLTMDDLGIGEA